MSRGMTQPSRRPRRRSPRIGSRGISRPMPDRPPAAVGRVALAASTSADGERLIHPPEIVAFQVAVQDVVAWRQVQDQGLAVVDVEALDLLEKLDAAFFLVDRQPVALQRQLVRGKVGSYDDDLVGGRALIADEEADGAGGHNGRFLPDLEILEKHVVEGAARRGLVPPGHGEWDRGRDRGQRKRERPRPAPPRPSPCHPVYLQMARVFTRPARTRRRIAMNFRWGRGLSSIHLILGYHAGTGPNGKRAQKAVREHSTLSSQTR